MFLPGSFTIPPRELVDDRWFNILAVVFGVVAFICSCISARIECRASESHPGECSLDLTKVF